MALSSDRIAAGLIGLGVRPGGVLMAHSSLSALGPVEGGAEAVIAGMLAALGPSGTLVMPAFRDGVFVEGLVDAVPAEVEAAARAVPAYDPATTPTGMGAIPTAFLAWPGVVRSAHPIASVAALGPRAADLIAPHALAWATGPGSPFERMYDRDAQQLLLGVGFNRLSLLHHAEALVPHGRRKTRVVAEGDRIVLAPDVGNDMDTHFPAIGAAMMAAGAVATGRIGAANAHLVDSRDTVAHAVAYLSRVLRHADADTA